MSNTKKTARKLCTGRVDPATEWDSGAFGGYTEYRVHCYNSAAVTLGRKVCHELLSTEYGVHRVDC